MVFLPLQSGAKKKKHTHPSVYTGSLLPPISGLEPLASFECFVSPLLQVTTVAADSMKALSTVVFSSRRSAQIMSAG